MVIRARLLLVALVITLASGTLASIERAHATADPKTIDKCQATLKKQGAKFIAKKFGALGKCTDGVGKCLQTLDDDAKRTACITKARGGCLKALATVTAARVGYVAAVSGACGSLDPAQVTGGDGLGFGAIDCTAFGGAVAGAADLGPCLAAQHDCLASRLFMLATPRARELMQFTPPPGVVVAPADVAGLDCLEDLGGTGADVDDVDLGKRLLKCQKGSTKAMLKLTSAPLKTFEKCIDALFVCQQTKTGVDLAKCRDKAGSGCVKAFDKLRTQRDALAASLTGPCGDPAVFAALRAPAGANGDALLAASGVSCSTLATLGDYQSCLETETEWLVADLVRFEAPTGETLLAGVGCTLGGCGTVPTPTSTATPAGPTATPVGATPSATATPQATVTPGGSCPTTYQLTFSEAGDEDFGYSGAYHDEPVAPNTRLTMGIANCANAVTPCGECTLTGPLENAGGAAFGNRRCRGTTTGADGSWRVCDDDGDCPGTGNACVFFAGPPQGVIGVPLCLLTEITGPIDGTIDLDTGATAFELGLRVSTFAAVSSFHPCPSCASGTCSAGENAGQPCTAQGISTFTGDPVSLDCPPDVPAHPIGVRRYRMPLSTGASAVTLSAASPDCVGAPGTKCFCQSCNDALATPCFDDADCVAVGATTCGGRRCTGGPNLGAPCTTGSQCPMGLCAVPGSNTHPNSCNDDVCTADPSDTDSVNEGVCLAGPSYKACAIEGLRGCNTNADCTFAGDSCITYTYNCFTDNGVLGSSISVSGVASTSTPTLGGLFCLPPTSSLAVDALIGLPGLGRVTLPAAAVLQ